MLLTISPVSRTVLLFTLSLSGCVSVDTGDDFVPDNECSLNLRTSGAVSAYVREVEGCSHRTTIVTEGGQSEVEITVGASPRDSRPFDHVALAFYELLGDAGEGIAVTIMLKIDETWQWRTADGSCTADYESEACSRPGVEDGTRYVITAVDCTEPAESETQGPVAIDQLSLTSTCEANR